MKTLILVALIALTSGCAALTAVEPNYIAPEVEHMSHMTQHAPFTDHPTNYGANIVEITAHWDLPKNLFAEVTEGYDVSKHWNDTYSNGEIVGPREQFQARFGYRFRLKP